MSSQSGGTVHIAANSPGGVWLAKEKMGLYSFGKNAAQIGKWRAKAGASQQGHSWATMMISLVH
jgi:hypothetical protein